MCTEKPRGHPLPLATTVLPQENFSQGAEVQRSEALSTQTWAPGFTGQRPHKKLCEKVWAYSPCPRAVEVASWSSLIIQPC